MAVEAGWKCQVGFFWGGVIYFEALALPLLTTFLLLLLLVSCLCGSDYNTLFIFSLIASRSLKTAYVKGETERERERQTDKH